VLGTVTWSDGTQTNLVAPDWCQGTVLGTADPDPMTIAMAPSQLLLYVG